MADWFADESLWRDVFTFEFGEAVIAQGEVQVDRALTLSGVTGGAALDLGCGPGRHAVPLAKRGFRVPGCPPFVFPRRKSARRRPVSLSSWSMATCARSFVTIRSISR